MRHLPLGANHRPRNKTASSPSTAVSALSLDQAKAVLALARGGAVSAADSIGVHRSSIYNWFKSRR